jgi:hypothetical protein
MMIYVCSPCRGRPPYTADERERNLRKAAAHCRGIAEAGHIPIAPHVFFCPFISEDDDREVGMRMGAELLRLCQEVWVFGKTISEGMRTEISLAGDLGIPVIYK